MKTIDLAELNSLRLGKSAKLQTLVKKFGNKVIYSKGFYPNQK